MRIVFFTSSTNRSGGSRQAFYLAEGLSRRGHEVYFLLREQASLRLLHPEASYWRDLGPKKNWRAALEKVLFPEGKSAREATVVHAFHNAAVKALAWWGLFWRPRGVAVFAHRGVVFRPGNPLPYWSPGIDCFIANSQACAAVLHGIGVSRKRLEVVYNAVPTERVTPGRPAAAVREELGLGPGFVFGCVAGESEVKGVDVLFKAYARAHLPESRLLVLGVEPLRWAPLLTALGIADRVLCVPHANAVADYLQLFNAFILPSRSESMPNTLLEAIRFGLPSICSEVGGVPEVLGESGLLVPPGDTAALGAALERMLKHDAAREAMARAAREQGPLFDEEVRLDAVERIYRKFSRKD